METEQKLRRRLKFFLVLFMVLLVLSGLTAFPLETELTVLNAMDFGPKSVQKWIATVCQALQETNQNYPFLAYGTDWLAFAHLAIAVFFIAPLRDPVKNVAVIIAGMLISLGIFPLAFIAGNIRGIPFYWQLIDCSFGVFSFLLLGYCLQLIRKLDYLQHQEATPELAADKLLSCPFKNRKMAAGNSH